MKKWTRRKFLKATGAAAATLAAKDVLALDLLAPITDPLGAYPYRGWETLYRDQYSYDYTARSTHSMNCTGSCTWKIYVKDGIAFKEEQYADFPDLGGHYPTYNPRGCQKGANYIEYVYGAQRIKYPLIRVGKRGEGKWRRASWDEALAKIASGITDTIENHGPDALTFYSAIPAKHFITFAGGARLANLTGGVLCSFYDWYCDLPPGSPITWGVQTDSCESADWVNSKYLILWGANLLETRIPDAHFMTEARMRGTKVVAIFPEYNPVSIHADLFVPVKPGTDSALGMAMANVIVNGGLHDAPYLKQFTDMPMLVVKDTNKFLRQSDMVSGGSAEEFYFWDEASTQPVLAPGTMGSSDKTLDLGGIQPALEGSFSVDTLAGPKQVTTVFELMKQRLASYTPAAVADLTGLDPSLITQLGQEFATTPPARIIEGAGTNHYFHNCLINRVQILLLALTGNVGKPGTGFDHYVGQEKIWPEHGFINLAFPLTGKNQRFQNTTLWTYVHANIVSDVDEFLPRSLDEYVKESVNNGWMPLYPEGTLDNGRDPKMMIIWGGNYLNQSKGYEHVLNNLWPKLDNIVAVNFRMDTSALYADVVLPAASFYEKWDLNSTDMHTFIHPFTPAIPPLYDSKTDWQIWQAMAQALQDTGYSYYDEKFGLQRNFANLVKDFTRNGAIADDKAACQYLLDHAEETEGMTMDQINTHPARFEATSDVWTSEIKPGVAYYQHQRMFERKRPLNTLNGRQQFYIDHDTFLELGEQLPTHKDALEADAGYPLRWITPHGRWSIHSTWRDAKYQLRLQRGRPIVYLSPAEASNRGLVDNDKIEIFNKNGSFTCHLCISPRLPDGMAQMYHGWERFTFAQGGWQTPTNIRINPTQLAGDYGQLKFKLNYWGPTGSQKDTRVEIRKFAG